MDAIDWNGALGRARAHAPFLTQAMDRRPDLVALLAAGEGAAALVQAKASGHGIADCGVALRRERQGLALVLGIGDLAGAFPLLEVTGELSAFADRALDAAIGDGIRKRVPDAEPAGFIALALGKHGAKELNYSSDIDPILLYDPLLLPRRTRDEPGEAAQRVARSIVETLAKVTADGYVFRVDLRLRPASEISPLAIPVEAALSHYESSALAWERAAFIRARACAGDISAGQDFLDAIRPFVWRKSLDFGAIREVGRLTAQIRASTRGSRRVAPGFNIKKGRGGIREVEFYAQTLQLIHGGRNPALRLRGTRATLDALAAAGLVNADDAALLGESYDRLRTIEHRLQMVADQQTHSLPENPALLDAVARLDGLADGTLLLAEVEAITDKVGTLYDALIEAGGQGRGKPVPQSPSPSPVAEPLETRIAQWGFADTEAVAARIEGWRSGRMRALRSDEARAAFDAVLPDILAAFAASPDPDRALVRWEQLLANLPSAINLFRLLEARPALVVLLGRILSLAPPLADELARRADLLDPLLDASAFDLPGDVDDLTADFARAEAGDDYQAVLDRVRRRVGELRFALGVQLIEGRTDPLAIAAALARIAEAAIRVLAAATVDEFRGAHGVVPGSELVVLGLGRMGGAALTHASDLDLIYLFGDGAGAGSESDGPRPLGQTLYYNRLGQRVTAALSVPTAEGALYEVDLRLRPSGEQGPPAASISSFARYQREQAWTWEHMALTRARVLFGSSAARAEVDAIIGQVLRAPRDPDTLRADVLEMRAKMAGHKPARGPLDAKLARGALVDLEFLVHYLQLRDRKGVVPHLGEAVRLLVAEGLIPAHLVEAHDLMTRLLVAARMIAPDAQVPLPAACAVLASACGFGDWKDVLPALDAARRNVALAWREAFGEELEIG